MVLFVRGLVGYDVTYGLGGGRRLGSFVIRAGGMRTDIPIRPPVTPSHRKHHRLTAPPPTTTPQTHGPTFWKRSRRKRVKLTRCCPAMCATTQTLAFPLAWPLLALPPPPPPPAWVVSMDVCMYVGMDSIRCIYLCMYVCIHQSPIRSGLPNARTHRRGRRRRRLLLFPAAAAAAVAAAAAALAPFPREALEKDAGKPERRPLPLPLPLRRQRRLLSRLGGAAGCSSRPLHG